MASVRLQERRIDEYDWSSINIRQQTDCRRGSGGVHDAMGFRESVNLLPQKSESGREGVSETKEARKGSSNAPGRGPQGLSAR